MQDIVINQPKKLVISETALNLLLEQIDQSNAQNVFVLTDPHVADKIKPVFNGLTSKSIRVFYHLSTGAEPSFSDFDQIILAARAAKTDFVVGVGGGSVLDIAKLVAALTNATEPISNYVGNGLIKSRNISLVCVPTTSGAGSESSPNAILIDDSDNSKKGIIDAVLMPDGVYIDPTLIASLPPSITAYTGLDALTHCIEAFANKFAHPVVDVYALEGIKLISQNLGKAIANGNDLEARKKVALGAYYGGMCLGPVNTAAVHALAYPLGTKFKIAHGLSNALLLPFVLEYNLEAAESRYAQISLAMGGEALDSDRETALQGIALIRKLIRECGMPSRLSELEIQLKDVDQMAADAMLIQRLLKNNVREVQHGDAVTIYQNAY
ncbi:iron-containing alcohol dehydrogenase [Marinoscillum sp. MHG1-6]|uniref:iron-containing alcohol dehydrogenase n=1 Tax=Marinoscillum sp. MHG1-6 TaxID=2959627 RepID=UPI00215872D5|nr:iron-containing alcohol dehydrogenase [Marinoscillum sp. MHG1-6]